MDKTDHTAYLERMKECAKNNDTEVAHSDADDILCELLIKLGYSDIVKVFMEMKKWYA